MLAMLTKRSGLADQRRPYISIIPTTHDDSLLDEIHCDD
ncbi:hypothetical protein GPB2148_3754 [marine gamma proteobacterium HTCC2148]|nr:hypothetical protein GPB2148_3754 [marine gamma proteobacterium HTCC2148]